MTACAQAAMTKYKMQKNMVNTDSLQQLAFDHSCPEQSQKMPSAPKPCRSKTPPKPMVLAGWPFDLSEFFMLFPSHD
jgi:hypothetical protein